MSVNIKVVRVNREEKNSVENYTENEIPERVRHFFLYLQHLVFSIRYSDFIDELLILVNSFLCRSLGKDWRTSSTNFPTNMNLA